jgi:dihydrofolate reductase
MQLYCRLCWSWARRRFLRIQQCITRRRRLRRLVALRWTLLNAQEASPCRVTKICGTLPYMIAMVVATDTNRVIGRENKIPWRLKDDLVALRSLTKGHAVVLGRKTYDSMLWYYEKSGKPMPGRVYVIVTRDTEYVPVRDNAVVAHSIEEALQVARKFDDQIYVNGGASIYEALLPYTDRIYLTEVQTQAEGDVYFPGLNPDIWHETSREHHTKDDRNEYDYDVVILDKA